MKTSAVATIERLREQGYHIRVRQLRQGTVGYAPFGMFTRHELRDRREKDARLNFHPRGGRTEVVITSPDGETKVQGEARCRQDDYDPRGRPRDGDNFVYRLGLTIALNRALKQLHGWNLTGHGSDGEGQFSQNGSTDESHAQPLRQEFRISNLDR